jgi:hypothetical protein
MAQTDGASENQGSEDDQRSHSSARHHERPYDGAAPTPPVRKANVDIHDPMFFWIFLLAVAVVLRILTTSTQYLPMGTTEYSIANIYSNFLLQFPGIITLPLIIGIVIGSEVGERSKTLSSALKNGLTNGIYASIIYLITIVIIYIILNYTTPPFSSLYALIINSVVLPIVVFMLTLEIFATLAYSRKVEA